MIALSPEIGRPIDDKTGLSGSFDLKLELAASAGNVRPSIFTALQEQLGLKLVAQRGKGEILVIDHAEQPSPN